MQLRMHVLMVINSVILPFIGAAIQTATPDFGVGSDGIIQVVEPAMNGSHVDIKQASG